MSILTRQILRAGTHSVHETAESLSELERALLSRISQKRRKRDDGDERDDEIGRRACARQQLVSATERVMGPRSITPVQEMRQKRERYSDEQYVDPSTQQQRFDAGQNGRSRVTGPAVCMLLWGK